LGRIQPHLFPAIFGKNEDEQLDYEGVRSAFEILASEINQVYSAKAIEADSSNKKQKLTNRLYTPEEIAYGFIKVANEAMARPIRNLTTMKGPTYS
jgi:5-oxoprolinase (ATP-hydrolysing)